MNNDSYQKIEKTSCTCISLKNRLENRLEESINDYKRNKHLIFLFEQQGLEIPSSLLRKFQRSKSLVEVRKNIIKNLFFQVICF